MGAEYASVPGRPGLEARLGIDTVRRALWVGPVIVAVFALLGGGAASVAAAIGVAIVVANLALAGWLLSAAASISMELYHAAALVSFLVRLGLIMAVTLGIAGLFEIDRPALGIAAVTAYLVLLTLEALAVVREGRKEFEWSR